MKLNPIIATPAKSHYDVIIVGGAMYGSSVAWFLSNNPDFTGSVLVVERDPTYEFCSTTHTNSCIRQQFSSELNVRISQFGAEFIKNHREFHGGDERVPQLSIQNYGYMYLADNPEFVQVLQQSLKTQIACGAGTKLMSAEEIAADYPFFNLDGILAGSHNLVDEGYFDGHTIFDWWKRRAREMGAEYISNEVVGMQKNKTGNKVESVTLKSGETITCDTVVNASGPRAILTCQMAGIAIPVEPRKRYTFIFDADTDGRYYLAGCPPDDDHPVDYDDYVSDDAVWFEKAWPAIANRIPQFEAIKLTSSWVGHYAFNTFDQNAILGTHHEVENFVFVNGFSGHGLQQSPAMGRGTAELIVYGEYRSLDLTPFNYERIVKNQTYKETAII